MWGSQAPDGARVLPLAASARAVVWLRALILAILCAFVVALVPLGVGISPAVPSYVHKSEAHAVSPVSNATGYIEAAAAAAGMSSGEFVATVVGVVGSATGLNIANETGVSLGDSMSDNLSALVYSANYPDYDLLPESEKQAWGSKTNYDAAKFNSLMYAFGVGDSVGRFYVSGGGDFDFTSDESAILNNLGLVGQTWVRRGSVAFEGLKSLVNRDAVVSAYGEQYEIYKIGEDESWPASWPRTVYLTPITISWDQVASQNRTYWVIPSRVVYQMVIINQNYGGRRIIFDRSEWQHFTSNRAGLFVPTVNDVGPFTTTGLQSFDLGDGEFCYYKDDGINNINNATASNWTVTYAENAQFDWQSDQKAMKTLLNGSGTPNYIDVVQYPENTIPDNTNVYFPEDENGNQDLNRDTPWQNFITINNPPYTPPTPEERPQNPFNPSDPNNPSYQSGTPEWKQETTENLQPALNIRFDKLFPFCLIYDIGMFWDKVKAVLLTDGLGEQAVVDYNTFRIPGVDLPGFEQGMELDLTWVRELLNMVKPFMFWLLLISMLMSVIHFWRRILTGA